MSVDYGKNFKLRLNKYIYGIDSNDGYWILKANLLAQPQNDPDIWMNKKDCVGYHYLCKHRNDDDFYDLKRELQRLLGFLVFGYMRCDYQYVPKHLLVRNVNKYIDMSIATFREFCIKWEPQPSLIEPPLDLITAGFMRRDGLTVDVIHKIVETYIDPATGLYLQWKTNTEFFGENTWELN